MPKQKTDSRPWKLYERIFEIKRLHPEWTGEQVDRAVDEQMQAAGFTGFGAKPSRRRALSKTESQKKIAKLEAGQEDGKDFDFEEQFLTRRGLKKFASEKNIPYPAIDELISDGKLKPKKFPNYAYKKYSTRQLGILLRQYNTY